MYERPGHRKYATAATTHIHGAPVLYEGVGGIALKQKTVSSGAGSGAVQTQIANGEQFVMIVKGRVEVPTLGGAVRGTPVYITAAHALTATSTGNTKFGLVVELAGQRGTSTGKMRVDLDLTSKF